MHTNLVPLGRTVCPWLQIKHRARWEAQQYVSLQRSPVLDEAWWRHWSGLPCRSTALAVPDPTSKRGGSVPHDLLWETLET